MQEGKEEEKFEPTLSIFRRWLPPAETFFTSPTSFFFRNIPLGTGGRYKRSPFYVLLLLPLIYTGDFYENGASSLFPHLLLFKRCAGRGRRRRRPEVARSGRALESTLLVTGFTFHSFFFPAQPLPLLLLPFERGEKSIGKTRKRRRLEIQIRMTL